MRKAPPLPALPAFVIGLCLALPAAAAETAACEAKYKEVAPAAIKLPYREFDQTEAGWRQLGNCFPEAVQLLGRYVRKQEAELRGVRWHLAQTLAMSGDNARAAEEALKSLVPDEARQQPSFSWNTYALATVAFLRGDRAAFDAQYEAHRIATEKHPENRTNLDVLTGLSRCFDRPYQEAYGSCRPAPP
ncbi:hypothetical protein [Roseateles sp.]|uniref:hypothetical protein n=1 Tax=Roseateles sp. TaxID=1971397 RepID=UPI0025DC09DF|nr:hypothetical protein [Roseateles sp.]MBV8034191.1 hypothetical protein [Roseateles sp.]